MAVTNDRHGHPLPAGAVARLGTVAFRAHLPVGAITAAPSGRRVVTITGGGTTGQGTLWDAAGRSEHSFRARAVALGDVAQISWDGSRCDVFVDDAWHELPKARGPLAIAPREDRFATGLPHDRIAIWNGTTQARTLSQRAVQALSFDGSGQRLLAGGRTVRIWELRNGRSRALPHAAPCSAVDWKRDRLVTATALAVRSFAPDGTLRWTREGPASGIALSPDGRRCAVVHGRDLIIYDDDGNEVVHTRARGRLRCVSWSGAGVMVAGDTPPALFDARGRRQPPLGIEGALTAVGWHGAFALTASTDGILRRWTSSGMLVDSWEDGHRADVRLIRSTPTGWLTVSSDLLRLWTADGPQERWSEAVQAVDATEQGLWLAMEGRVELRDWTGRPVRTIERHAYDLAAGPLLALAEGKAVTLFDTDGTEVRRLAVRARQLAWSQRGLLTLNGRSCQLWDVSGRGLAALLGEEPWLWQSRGGIGLAVDGDHVVVGARHPGPRVIDLLDGETVQVIPVDAEILALRQGRLVTGHPDTTGLIWALDAV